MNYQDLRDAIYSRKPRYSAAYKPLVERISTKGDATGKGGFTTFGAFYQTFMYAYIIALRFGKKTPLPANEQKVEFAPIGKWKPAPIRDFIIITLFNRSEQFDSYKWSWLYLADSSKENVDNFITALIREMEGYANTGLEYLQKKWDEEKTTLFTLPSVFVDILEDLPNKTAKKEMDKTGE